MDIAKPVKVFLFLLAAGSFFSCQTIKDTPNETVRSFFHAVSGTWKLEGKPLYESWEPFGESYKGRVYVLKNKDTLVRETIRIIFNDTTCIYRVTVKNQNQGKPVNFTLHTAEEKMVFFENPKHDFPTSIRYRLQSKDTLIAQTSGIINGEEKRVEFRYSRQ